MASTSTALPTAVWNYSAGPGVLPRKVLERAQADMLNFAGLQHSIMEMSHRSKEFEAVLAKAEADFRALLAIPSTYKVLFMQGGATSQFSAVVYNLIGGDLSKPVDYVVTGVWSQKAAEEAKAMGANVHRVVDTKPTNHDGSLPPVDQWKFHADAQYAYFCDNETVHGVEFNPFPFDAVPAGVPLVCDMSSSILSRPVDVSRFAVIFAGAQKNMGPAGVTVVIVREDLIKDPSRRNPSLRCPLMLDYKIFADNNSMYNTPPTWAIYVAGLVFDWLRNDVGGLEAMAAINAQKSKLVYDAIDGSNGFYRGPVKPALRSRMNVPFRIYKDGVASKELEVVFAKEAEARGLVQLAGHRSVGGMRASLYNSLPLEGAQKMPASRQSSTPAPTDLADFILPGYAATIGLSLLLALLSFPVWRETMEGFPHPSVSMEEDGPRLVRALYFVGSLIPFWTKPRAASTQPQSTTTATAVAAAAAAPTTAAADGGAGVADESEQEGGGSAIPNPDVFSDDPPERVNWRFKLMVLDYVAHDLPKILRWAVLALILDQVILHTIPNLPSYRAIVVFLFSPKRPRRLMKRLPGLLRLCVFFLFLMRVNVHATVKHVQRLILIWLAPRDTVNPDAVLGDRRFLGEGRQVREYSPSQRVKRWAVEERERVRTERAERVARLAGGGGGGERGRDSGGGVGGGDGLDGARSSAGVADGADGANGADGQSIADAVHRQRQLRGLDNSH